MLAKTWSKWPSLSFDGETQNSLNHLEKCLAEPTGTQRHVNYLTYMMLSNRSYTKQHRLSYEICSVVMTSMERITDWKGAGRSP